MTVKMLEKILKILNTPGCVKPIIISASIVIWLFAAIWLVVNMNAAPGSKVSLCGIIEYTKKQNDEDHSRTVPVTNDHNQNATDIQTITTTTALPEISISESVSDENNAQINLNSAPFIIRVKGSVTNAKQHFTYLVVNDYNADWIEPTAGMGANVDGEFSRFCYLGQKDTAGSLRNYEVYAVVTNREYKEREHLDRKTVLASSNKILLRRTR